MEDHIPAPSDLDDEAVALWDSTQQALRDQGTFIDSDAALLERYIRAITLARLARKDIDKPVVKGSQGQPVPHPLIKVVSEAEKEAHKYAEALLLTPQTRKRHGVSAVQGSDDLEELLGDG